MTRRQLPMSHFSGLHNPDNISLDPECAAICCYTDADLDTVFAPELPGLNRDEIRAWYNGYHWLGEKWLYNPFDVLLLFRKREFMPTRVRVSSSRVEALAPTFV